MLQHILIVEDEAPIRAMLTYALELKNFVVTQARDSIEAMVFLKRSTLPDLMIVDWMLPKRSGVEFIQLLRQDQRYQNIPIIMLTAKTEELDKVKALGVGADDYLVKPFSPPELIARIGAILRRGPVLTAGSVLECRGLCLDISAKQLCVDGSPVKLGPLEYNLLHFFLTHQKRVFSRDELLSHVWGSDKFLDERTVDVHIRRLRKRLGAYGGYIQTVHGSGYRFNGDEHATHN